MPTLKTVEFAPFLLSINPRRYLMMRPGEIADVAPGCLLALFLDQVDGEEQLRLEVNHRGYLYWASLPPGRAADLYFFAGLLAYPRARELVGAGRCPGFLMEFVDLTHNQSAPLGRIRVAA